MRVLDASSIIYAWDNYPPAIFPPLWFWMGQCMREGHLKIPSVAFDEVRHKAPECAVWMLDQPIMRLPMTEAILLDAMRIKNLIGVVADRYHPKGVGENDLFIIATARAHQATLVSDEERQLILPLEPTKVKIPAVCVKPDVDVQCESFLEFLKQANQVFS
jgi:predicted nucleic acid-binding protein